MDVLPSASLRFALDKNSDLRLVYGRGLARPDPQDISAAVSQPTLNQTPGRRSVIGNPNLKAEHANNYDMLYERYLSPLGLIQAGYFYKDLTDPIVHQQFLLHQDVSACSAGNECLVTQPSMPAAPCAGRRVRLPAADCRTCPAVRGRRAFRPTTATPPRRLAVCRCRTDQPALLRQAPNSWNISPTFDTKRFSMRVGMTFDDTMIYAYQYQNLTRRHAIAGDSTWA